MSSRITAKNLSYDAQLPPFLAVLRAQASGASGPDPLAASWRRTGRKRTGSQEAEDAPLVVDAHGNALSLRFDGDGGLVDDPDSLPPHAHARAVAASTDSGPPQTQGTRTKSTLGPRKRKAGRVVGDAAAADAGIRKMASDCGSSQTQIQGPAASTEKKAQKKPKKIKPSFDEDEG